MKPGNRKPQGITPTFPEMRDGLIPSVSAKGEAPPATGFPGSFLSGFACAVNERPAAGSEEWQKLYDAYLASPRWKEKCVPIRARANGHCERCRRACATLEVHHLTYERFGGAELPEDLLALCRSCHDIADEERKKAWARQLAKWEVERMDALDNARFHGWARAKYGEDFFNYADYDAIREAHEEYDEWCSDCDGGR